MALCTTRLRREYVEIQRNKLENIKAAPKETNIREWHYVITGQKDSPYAGGFYHGTVLFPSEYPYKPPTIRMITPSGRFKPGARLCLSMSDFHPETWNPMWSVSTILLGLYSFMNDTAPTNGSMESSEEEKKLYAKASMEFNLKDKVYCEMFPDLVQAHTEQLRALETSEDATAVATSESAVVEESVVTSENAPADATVHVHVHAAPADDSATVAETVSLPEETLPATESSQSSNTLSSTEAEAACGYTDSSPSGVVTAVSSPCKADTMVSSPSPNTPPVSSMYSRMMAMKLGSSPAIPTTSDSTTGTASAVSSPGTSFKSVQSVTMPSCVSYKPPAEDQNRVVLPPQPPV